MSSQREHITGIQQEMRSALASGVQKPERFDVHVRKFRSICVMHGVQVGSDAELPIFLHKLLDDRHLAMDFWAFVGKVSSREGGDLSDEQLLRVVVEGISGSDIAEVGEGQQSVIDDLRAMLAGVDIQPPPVEMAPFPRKDPTSDHGDEPPWNRSSESPVRSSNLKPRYSVEREDREPDQPPPAPPTLPVSGPVDETLLRLELTRLLQQYFDYTETKIKRPAPDLHSVASPVTRRSMQEPATEAEKEEVRFRRLGRSRLVLDPTGTIQPPAEEPLPLAEMAASGDLPINDDLPINIPLSHYSPPTRFGRAPIILMLVFLCAGIAIYRDPSLVRHGLNLIARQFRAENALIRVNIPKEPVNTDPVLPPPTSSQPQASASTPSRPGLLAPLLNGTSTPPPTNKSTASPLSTSPQAPPPDRKPSLTEIARDRFGFGSGHNYSREPAPTESAPEESRSSIDSPGVVNVSPSVMDRNLIVSRVPAYPEEARERRVEGDVIMRALISKDGTVERLQVMQGDSRLRSAAEDAVYKWRYKPYTLNGQPVEVATTVTVNFNLNH